MGQRDWAGQLTTCAIRSRSAERTAVLWFDEISAEGLNKSAFLSLCAPENEMGQGSVTLAAGGFLLSRPGLRAPSALWAPPPVGEDWVGGGLSWAFCGAVLLWALYRDPSVSLRLPPPHPLVGDDLGGVCAPENELGQGSATLAAGGPVSSEETKRAAAGGSGGPGNRPEDARYSLPVSSGTRVKRSPTRPTSATWKMGASSSLLMATMILLSFMPARCWMAPEMPTAT